MKQYSFEKWQQLVNREIVKRTGFGIDDLHLPDFDYWNAWDDELDPEETAILVISAARDY